MIIIAPSLFSDALHPLINHKNSVGIETTLKTVESIYDEYEGRDNAEQIKYFIKHALDEWHINYAMIVGNKELVPVRYSHIHSSSGGPSNFITDLYYADVYNDQGAFCSWDSNGNNLFGEMNDNEIIDHVDLYPDVCIGRL